MAKIERPIRPVKPYKRLRPGKRRQTVPTKRHKRIRGVT